MHKKFDFSDDETLSGSTPKTSGNFKNVKIQLFKKFPGQNAVSNNKMSNNMNFNQKISNAIYPTPPSTPMGNGNYRNSC